MKKYSKLERSGLIQTFEFTFELAWKTLQDLLMHRGYEGPAGPRPVIEGAFRDDLALDGPGIDFSYLLDVRLQLDDLNLPYGFDLVDMGSNDSVELEEHVNRVGQTIFERN